MKNAIRINKRFWASLLAILLLLANLHSTFAEEYDYFTQMIVNQVKADMEKKGYSEDDYTIEVTETGDINVVIQQTSHTATPAPQTSSPSAKTEADYAKSYATGVSLEVTGEWIKAVDAFVESNGYRDAVDRILPYLEEYAHEMIDAEEYRKAQSALLLCNVPELSNLLTTCNDYCFTLDLADGLNARWARSQNIDTSLMSDREYKKYIRSLINEELFYLEKYANLSFNDKLLAQYAYQYLGALQSQLDGIEHYGENDAAYTEYYTTYGYNVRAQMIYWLNRKYGIETDTSFNSTLKKFVGYGQYIDEIQAIEHSIAEQIEALELNFKPAEYGWVSQLDGFSIKNTSGYEIETIEFDLRFLDHNGRVVEEIQQIYYGNSVRIGDDMDTENPIHTGVIDKPFNSIEIAYHYYVYSNGWNGITGSVDFKGSVAPRRQWRFDGENLYVYDILHRNSDDMASATKQEKTVYTVQPTSSSMPTFTLPPTTTPTATPTFTPLPTTTPTATVDDKWFMSDDGIAEVKITSVDTSKFPTIMVYYDFRLDGEKESLNWYIKHDLSAEISNYITQNPSYQNRKVPVTVKEAFDIFEWKGGTVYYLFLTYVIGNKNPIEVQKGMNIDFANVFPDDFVNYDAHNAARAIKASAEKLNLSSYSVKNCMATKSVKFDSVSYYKFTLVEGTWAQTYLAIFSGSNYAVILYNENNLISLATEVSALINKSAVLGNPKYDNKCAGYIAEYIDIEDTSAYHLSSITKYLD